MMMGKSKILIVTLLTLLSTTVFATTINKQYNATVCGTGTYLFGCDQLTASGDYNQTYVDRDSTVTVHLLFADNMAKKYSATIEPGQKYLFGCQVLSADAVETNKLQRVGCGCDSTVQLTLSVVAPPPTEKKVQYNAEIEVDQTYLFGCKAYHFTETGPQTLIDTIHLANNVDSIITVNLTVAAGGAARDTAKVQYSAEINPGEKYLFGCRVLEVAGTYADTLAVTATHDSVVVLHLSYAAPVLDTAKVQYSAVIKKGEKYLFGCRVLEAEGTYYDTLSVTATHDSVVALHLSWAPDTVKVQYDATIKAGEKYLFGCRVLDTKGTYADTLAGVGRDSVIVLNLDVLTTTYGDTTAVECDSIWWYGNKYTVDGDYEHTFVGGNVFGGDSILTMHLTIVHPMTGTDNLVGCDSVPFKGIMYYADVVVYDTILGGAVNGCDSIVTMNITVKYHATGTDNLVGCDSVPFKGIMYYADAIVYDTILGGAVNGCDSIVTMNIHLLYSNTGDTTAVECDSFTWFGTTYTTSGDYNYTLTNISGCDSVVTLHLTINYSAATTRPAETACDSLYWAEADTMIYTSGIYTHVFKTVLTCDSVVTFDVTINNSKATTVDTVKRCNQYRWEAIDSLIITTGTYTHVFKTTEGCDSVVTMPVEIAIPYEANLSLIHKFGDRLLMINRNEINAIDGWYLDSLGIEHPEYVVWYEIDPNGNEKKVGEGYYYSLASGEPLPAGYTYYAVITIPATDGNCGTEGKTQQYTIPVSAGVPALVPSYARPGEDIRIINLNPEKETTIRIFSTEGVLQKTYTVRGEETFTIKAAYGQGFYLVELSGEDMKSTLRYIVK